MPTTTPKFGLTLMPDNVLTPEVLINEGLSIFDLLVANAVLDYTATPPGGPSDGDIYLVAGSATGAWSGHDQAIAFYIAGWNFITAPQYFMMYNVADGFFYRKGASTWAKVTTVQEFSGYLPTVSDQNYVIKINVPFGGTIVEATTICESGTATGTFKINTTALGGTANSISSTEDQQSQASNNVFVAGDDLVLTISSSSSCVGVSYTLKYTKAFSLT